MVVNGLSQTFQLREQFSVNHPCLQDSLSIKL
jgi:hypothetical protein